MLNPKTNQRELCYVVIIDDITPLKGYDRVELAHIAGWTVVVGKNQFQPGDAAIYFEIDSKLPEKEPFSNIDFLVKKKFKVKTQKMCGVYSQGLIMSAEDFGWHIVPKCEPLYSTPYIVDNESHDHHIENESRFLTAALGVTYAEASDNQRKAENPDKIINSILARHPFIAKKYGKIIKKYKILYILFSFFFGKKKDKKTGFPTHFPYVKKTDQERIENMTWVLKDKTPFIVTEKCDGSSGTYILERKPFGRFEFYVCSRNVRQLNEKQKSYYDENYYWECAKKYDIENKLKDYLKKHPDLTYVCWQGEVCGPGIQKNPHGLSETKLFCFHMIDSKIGKYDIRDAIRIWEKYDMEHVPIRTENYILPDNLETLKNSAEGFYVPFLCEGKRNQPREGFVYYKTTDPNFSFKNVSRSYLLKH